MATKKVQRGYIYMTSGELVKVQPLDGKKFKFEELQMAVGGYIEMLRPKPKQGWTQMFANEEGVLYNLPRNPRTAEAVDMAIYMASGYPPGWTVLGNIIGIKSEDPDENTFPTIRAVIKTELKDRILPVN